MKLMTQMENAIMNMTGCDRQTANLVANAILDIDKETEKTETEELKMKGEILCIVEE